MQVFLILFYTLVIRIYFISEFPPISNPSILPMRFLSAVLSVITVFILYLMVYKKTYHRKVALLSAWVYANLFWTIEQGRIAPQIHIWIIETIQIPFISLNSLKNVFTILSPEYLFFKNVYFWWGGVRDFGIINLAFMPFFYTGAVKLIIEKRWKLISVFLLITIITALSPTFPETREFYLTTPIMAYAIALGIDSFIRQKSHVFKIITFIIFAFFVYELIQYFHFYITHYIQDINTNMYQLKEAI